MVCFIFPGKNFIVLLFASLLLLFCCHVSCVLVTVTRRDMDLLSYPGIFKDCSGVCHKSESYVFKDLTKQGICICQCGGDYHTIVTAKLKCFKDKDLRNATGGSLDFQLYKNEQPNGYLEIISFDSKNITILFNVQGMGDDKKCQLNDIEQLSRENPSEWNSVKHLLNDVRCFELDDDDIERTYTWLPLSYEGWMKLTLKWKVDPTMFVGRIMRLNVTCQRKTRRRPNKLTGLMVFKVNGTFEVPDNTISSTTLAPSTSTEYYFSPTSSVIASSSVLESVDSTTSVYSPTMTVLSTSMTSSPLLPLMSSSVVPITSSLLKSVTSSLHQPMTSSTYMSMMSSTYIPMMSSTSQPMASLTSSLLISSSAETTKIAYSSILSSMVIASSMTVVGPATSSKSSSSAAVTGGVVAGIVVLLVIVVLVVYIFRKRRLTTIRSREKHGDIGNLNPNYSSFSNMRFIPALNNPLNDGVYENPEVVDDEGNRRSGLISIDSAAYDSCLVVENPSNKREVKSAYDNIPGIPENTYKALDPARREPSAKYQSLIKPENEYSTVADVFPDGPLQEPLYSEIDRLPSPVPRRNGPRPNAPTPPPFNHKNFVNQPIYNELENSGEGVQAKDNEDPTPPPLAPRKSDNPPMPEPTSNGLGLKSEDVIPAPPPLPPSIPKTPPLPQKTLVPGGEPVENELEDSGNPTEEDEKPNEVANGFEESNESDNDNGLEYSVLENDN